MGRLTQAMRRAADVASKGQPDHFDVVQAGSDAVGATDDLFPIELENGDRDPSWSAAPDGSAALGAEPAGSAVIPPASPAVPPGSLSNVDATSGDDVHTHTASSASPDEAASTIDLRDTPPDTRAVAPQSELFERLDATLAQKIVVDQNIMPVSREQYRRLAATLHHAQADTGLKVVMICSAVMGEGKTLTASNLALTFSESYKRSVLLIDGDFRRPALHVVFNLDAPVGLSEGLISVIEQKLPLYRVSPRLTILPAGSPSSDPMAGLTSNRMRRVIQEARAAFDWVIVDTPPVALLPDANLLATMVDGAVLVVRAGATPYHQVVRAVDALTRERLLGVVLNSATVSGNGVHNYYTYYHGARPPGANQQ
jgi:protein-tyrosine kinase